jgi:hypothetical protein
MQGTQRAATVLIRVDAVRTGRTTHHRLTCSDCGQLDPPVRSKHLAGKVAAEHAKEHPLDRVQML